MRRDYRPYTVIRACRRFQKFYTGHFLKPQLEHLGRGYMFMKPWYVELFGGPISIGNYATVIGAPDGHVRICVWPQLAEHGRIRIGNYCLICPGVRISSASEIRIADNCMLANGVYITDSDWHDIYNRTSMGKTRPVRLMDNAWVGDSAIVCKGVTIGENSIVGAGSVVIDDVPPNVIAAGNPARVVKQLDPREAITTRQQWFADPDRLSREFARLDRARLSGNTVFGWMRSLLFPGSHRK